VSRSTRKTPIFGISNAASEALDKRIWHKRLRSQERDQLSKVGPDTDHVSIHQNAVSNIASMAKDGRQWFGLNRQAVMAVKIAARRETSLPQRKSLQARLLAKWRSK
jgi:hypothetical protein